MTLSEINFLRDCKNTFADVLERISGDKGIKPLMLKDITHYSKSAIYAYLSGEKLPRSVDDVVRIIQAIHSFNQDEGELSDQELKKQELEERELIIAWVCDQAKRNGLIDHLRDEG